MTKKKNKSSEHPFGQIHDGSEAPSADEHMVLEDIDTKTQAAQNGEPAVLVENISMVFNIANERLNSLKEYFLKIIKRELFFKEFYALQNISLRVEKGDVFGIVGVNGSGKSTLLKIIAGVMEPTRGKCIVNGTIAPLIELGAGFDFELTAHENIYLNGALLGYSNSFIKENFDEIVDFAELKDFLELPMKNYSSGMVARIAFAIATMMVPDVLIVDETLSVGDMFFQEKCEARINALINDYGTTVLFVSHDINVVERLCKKAIWIEKGVMRANGAVTDVCEMYRSSQ
jgi:ABC-2 type transport system ATP-binding protein